MTSAYDADDAGRRERSTAHARRIAATIVLAGPDGAGKTSIATRLASDLLTPPLLHLHHRPGMLPSRTVHDGPVTEPHAQQPYSTGLSGIKLVYLFADYQLGWWTRVRRTRRRGGSVLLERGWWDLTVDPRRYRLAALPRTHRLLSRSVPRPDLTVVLLADPAVLASRKSELPVAELTRQVTAWRRFAQAQPNTLLVDAAAPIDTIVSRIRKRLAS